MVKKKGSQCLPIYHMGYSIFMEEKMKKISVNDLNKALSQEGVMVIDVRTMEEFKRSHIPGVINIPTEVVHDHENLFKKQHVHVICNSGNRSAMVIRDMISKGIDNLTNVEGGMVSWVKSGLPISGKSKQVMPMMRQVMIVAGLMILSGVALHFLVNPKGIYLSGFVGLGLFYAGVSGHCYMTKVLGVLPWNNA